MEMAKGRDHLAGFRCCRYRELYIDKRDIPTDIDACQCDVQFYGVRFDVCKFLTEDACSERHGRGGCWRRSCCLHEGKRDEWIDDLHDW